MYLFQGYLYIYFYYFNCHWMTARTEPNPPLLTQYGALYGFPCCHLKNSWTASLPPETVRSSQMITFTTSIDIMRPQAAYANFDT